MIITIDTDVNLFYTALATVRAAYEDVLQDSAPGCPTCGAHGKDPCKTKHGKRADRYHTYRRLVHLA